ncbi:hypothetical protein B0H14DRAFT_3072455 [Mycena olivaceomarginata]|nr:hypothetical protein B0H14DRAFT_3072455 [Mycena olivaceomarginata]
MGSTQQARRRKMSDLFDMPLDSSPLKPPSPIGTTPPGSTALVIPRLKRPAEDLSQFAGEVSRAHKLKKEDHEALIGFSSLGREEKMVSLAGQLLAIAHHQSLIQPAPKEWKVPKMLMDKLSAKAGSLMVDPSIPAYREHEHRSQKIDLVFANPSWGFGVELRDEKYAMDALGSTVSVMLANKRNTVKNVILSSLGSDPENPDADPLCPDAMNIVNLAKAILVELKVKSVQLDIRICGRVAVLRQLISESDDNKYWASVDKELALVRAKHPDPVLQSRFIKRYILDPDFQTYGAVDLTSLAAPSVRVAGPSTALQAPAVANTSDDDRDDD